MSWGTDLIITMPVNAELVFLAVRRVTGIPAEHPFTIMTDHYGDTGIWNDEPNDFEGATVVWHHNGLPLTSSEDTDPVGYVRVHVESSYGVPDGPELHKQFTADVGAWCESQGLEWWTRDESDEHGRTWRERTPAYS